MVGIVTSYIIEKEESFSEDLNEQWLYMLLAAHAFDLFFIQFIKICVIFLISRLRPLDQTLFIYFFFPETIYHLEKKKKMTAKI
jgi:hypothetical protein